MITWNGFNFCFPRSQSIVSIFLFHDFIIVILFSIITFIFVGYIGSYFLVRFNLSLRENHRLEFIWTVIPFLILSFVILSSVSTLYFSDSCLFCGIRVFINGHQWYWSYSLENFLFFDSYMIDSSIRLLDVDNRVWFPCYLPVRLLCSSADVIHSWTIPSLGVKIDCIPGRINQSCICLERVGIFFGQCSEICGANHRFIPIVVERF